MMSVLSGIMKLQHIDNYSGQMTFLTGISNNGSGSHLCYL